MSNENVIAAQLTKVDLLKIFWDMQNGIYPSLSILLQLESLALDGINFRDRGVQTITANMVKI